MLLKTWNIITEKFFGLLVRKHGNGIIPFKPDVNIFFYSKECKNWMCMRKKTLKNCMI